ncbi:alpha/beta fold hydrolase [Lutibacter oricola]|nr:alpha/beta hydrolase [Lutibacter oricola]
MSTPKSSKEISKTFSEGEATVLIEKATFNNFNYRVLKTKIEVDTTLTTLVFVHGSIGSAMDFKSYLIDEELNKKANLIAYDRVGYGIYQTGNVQASIQFEVELLENLIKDLNPKNTILVGYSYGGPIALASKKDYKKIMLLAPAVYSKVEPMPWGLNFYKWKATRWVMPEVWKAASKEKLGHKADLLKFENNWADTPSNIISIHGNKDWIVPFGNSIYLEQKFPKQQFELVTLNNAGHGLVWSNFNEIKKQLLQQLN